MTPSDERRLRAAIAAEQRRATVQIAALERSFAGIVEASELTSTDDEHDPEGATIAYERAQVAALLRGARYDLTALAVATRRLADGTITVCADCAGPIALDRVIAVPTGRVCIRCAP